MKRLEFEDVLVSCLSRIESEGDSGLDAVCDEYPAYADQLRQRVKVLRDAGLLIAGAEEPDYPERLGEFRLLERLGQGGMGVVFLAEQTTLGRQVALKVVRPEQLLDRHARARFAREVETVARLAHPGIVPVHAVGEQDGLPYFAMEYVRGASLEQVVRELAGRDAGALTGRDLLACIERASGEEAAAGAADRAPFDGAWVDANSRRTFIVGNRDTLVQVHYEVAPEWVARDIEARLHLTLADGSEVMMNQILNVGENSNEYDLQLGAAELMGALFKTHKEFVAGLVQQLRNELLPECFGSQEQKRLKFALFILDDMVEHLGPTYFSPEDFQQIVQAICGFSSHKSASLR